MYAAQGRSACVPCIMGLNEVTPNTESETRTHSAPIAA